MKKIIIALMILALAVTFAGALSVTVWAAEGPEDAGATDTPAATVPAETVTAPEDEGGSIFAEVTTVPAIVVLCLLVGLGVKVSPLDDKYIPVIVGAAGGIIGFLAYHVMPDFPGGDPVTAVAIGAASGLAATGVHQVVKQLTKG